MMRSTFLGSAARALSARAIALVSRCERYSTPAGERYSTDCKRHRGVRMVNRVDMAGMSPRRKTAPDTRVKRIAPPLHSHLPRRRLGLRTRALPAAPATLDP